MEKLQSIAFTSKKAISSCSSYFFVLPHKSFVFEKLKTWSKPDCYVIDLQDGCPNELKEMARENIKQQATLLGELDRKILLRVNDFGNEAELKKDMELLSLGVFDGIMLPMINRVENIQVIDRWLQNIEEELGTEQTVFEIVPLIETVYSTVHINRITSSSDRITAIALGLFDLFADSNASMNQDNVNFISNLVMLATKSAGLPFIDSPFTEIHDYAAFYADCKKTADIGSDGKLILHPDHIDIVNNCFSISEKEKKSLTDKLNGYTGGCSINKSGEFIGPPVEKKIKRQLLKKVKKKRIPANSIRPRTFKYGLDLNTVYEGQALPCPYEISVDESWTTLWSSLVPMGNFIETSDVFSQHLGLPKKLLPFSAMLNLTLCMAVEPFSETCLLHLGLEEVVYEKPAHAGDTFRCYIFIEKLRNTSDGRRSVITSRHILLNQNSERILSFKRKTLFPKIDDLEAKIRLSIPENSKLNETLATKNTTVLTDFIDCSNLSEHPINCHKIASNELLIHDASRHLGESENLLFTTLFRNTHPVHFNYLRYQKKDIIVCGGFVLAITLANALKDLKQVVDQRIISCSHINKIAPMDTISSVSYIHSRKLEDNLEVLTIKTLGIRNVDIANELNDCDWPLDLFAQEDLRPAKMEKLLREEMPELFHKVCIQILWKVWRPITK